MLKTIKKLLIYLSISMLVAAGTLFADVYIHPHSTQNGLEVQGHVRSNPNNTTLDNFSTRGNINPYTGQPATKSP